MSRPLSHLRLNFIGRASHFRFAELPQPMALLGGGVIIAGPLYIARREAVRKREPSRPAAGPSPD